MGDHNKLVNYYKILECEKTATEEELKKNYQRLVLASHPDKKQVDCATFQLIHKAWTVLRDPMRRKQYDAELSCQEHSNLLLYDTVKQSDMTYHSEHGVYMYNCRCGGVYMLDECDANKPVLIGCDECSFSIKVN